MGTAKWIAGFLGWVTLGPIGALLGFIAGALWDNAIDVSRQVGGGQQPSGGARQNYGRQSYSATEQRNSFFVSLLVLSSAITGSK